MLGIRTVNTEHVSIANTTPGLKMKLSYEATAYKSDTKFVRQPRNLLEPQLPNSAWYFFADLKGSPDRTECVITK